MSDYANPGRRYKSFRPRDAVRGLGALSSPVNKASVGLYNNSAGIHYLVVRSLNFFGSNGNILATSYVKGDIGGTLGTVQPMLASGAVPDGIVRQLDTATSFPTDYAFGLLNGAALWWPHDFPIAVVEPGWSFVVQNQTSTATTWVGLVWEAVFPDQLDWFY